MKIKLIAVLLGLSAAACGAAPDAADEASGSTAEDLTSTAWMNVAGSYTGDTDAQFADLVLDRVTDAAGHRAYFLEQHAELISCSSHGGCTLRHEREDGWYSATATHLTLHPSGGPERVYAYVRSGADLELHRAGATGAFASLASYCDTAADCGAQGLIRPYCQTATSGWVCGAADHACSYACSGATP